jgi:hypothetical protein
MQEFQGVKGEDKDAYAQAHGTPYRHSRAECPDCRQRDGKRVVRIRKRVVIAVDVIGPEPPELPVSLAGGR